MPKSKQSKYDKVGVGVLTGLVLPLIIFFIVYMVGENDMSFLNYLAGMRRMQALVKIGSLCVFTNVGAFWMFLKLKYEKAARGVLGATILYALLVLILRAG